MQRLILASLTTWAMLPMHRWRLYSRPDLATSVDQLLPTADQDLGQMELSFALSGIRWGTLGSSELMQFMEAGDRQALTQFQADLAAIELKIKRPQSTATRRQRSRVSLSAAVTDSE